MQVNTCPNCGWDLDEPLMDEPPHGQDLVRHFGATRGRQGIYKGANQAEQAFRSLYPSQPELQDAAMAGWREAVAS